MQAYCQGASGRNEPSFGRRKRALNESEPIDDDETTRVNGTLIVEGAKRNATDNDDDDDDAGESSNEYPEHVREMIEVYESREEIENELIPRKLVAPAETLCITPSEYHGLIAAIILLLLLLFSITLAAGLAYRYAPLLMIFFFAELQNFSSSLTDVTGKQC